MSNLIWKESIDGERLLIVYAPTQAVLGVLTRSNLIGVTEFESIVKFAVPVAAEAPYVAKHYASCHAAQVAIQKRAEWLLKHGTMV